MSLRASNVSFGSIQSEGELTPSFNPLSHLVREGRGKKIFFSPEIFDFRIKLLQFHMKKTALLKIFLFFDAKLFSFCIQNL